MLKRILAFAILCGAMSAHAQSYDFQCMSLCTNAKYDYAFCQMQCARGSEPSISPRSGLGDALNGISQRNLQDAQTKLLQEQTKALQQQNAQQPNAAPQANANQLKTAIEQLTAELKGICAREEYRPLFVHTACNANDITLEQLTDKSLIAATDKPLYSKLRSEGHALAIKFENAIRSYGGPKGADMALARERADSLIEKNDLALYEEEINWGEYNKHRKDIYNALREEVNKIARQ